jgi:ATP/maltotriose-dependent transcriptional regulator MalT
VRPANWSGAAGPPAAPAVRDGVVSRPGLFELLGGAGRVTVVSAPAGSGKTLLLRSWIGEGGLAERAAWVAVHGEERDPQRFWLSVVGALRDTAAGSKLVRPVTAAPDLDGWAVIERLLADLGGLEDRVWLVIDDVQELRSAEAVRQLELLVMRAPAGLRFVLATRHDLRLGLHRLRLEGELTEIRMADLRFTLDEARVLFEAAGIPLSDTALVRLYERAAVLRLAQDDPDAAIATLAPVIDGSVPLTNAQLWVVQASWLDAIARDALGDAGAARRALERALDLAKPEGLLFPFLIAPVPDLLERHRRLGTAHAVLISEILNVLAGRTPVQRPDSEGGRGGAQDIRGGLREPLSQAEARVLRYLPTKLSAPEIADQLYLSVNTVKTHMRHLYDKLGVHRRHEAVEQARAVGLLAPSSRR